MPTAKIIEHTAQGAAQIGTTDVFGPVPKTSGLALEEFRSLFTQAELMAIDSFADAAYLATLTPAISLTNGQRANMRFFLEKARSHGASNMIDVTGAKMSQALTFLEGQDFIASGRKAQIIAGTVQTT